MSGNERNLWGRHELSRHCFDLDMDHSLRGLNPDFASPFFSDPYLGSDSRLRPPQEGDQVVPSSQRVGCSVLGQREKPKALPPLPPDPEELMSDEAADQEVEFFTSDRRSLLPKTPCKGSSRHNGQVNFAYQEAAFVDRDAGNLAFVDRDAGNLAFVNRDAGNLAFVDRDAGNLAFVDRDAGNLAFVDRDAGNLAFVDRDAGNLAFVDRDAGNLAFVDRDAGNLAFSWPGCDDRLSAKGDGFGVHGWESRDSFWSKPDALITPRTRFSLSVPPVPDDKPELPPRIPIKPRNQTLPNDGKPPKIPPRVPLVPPCPPRTPSPKSLPIYINGVMPPTQSFAANPNYVSKAAASSQRPPSGERAPPTSAASPCIVPILRDGRQASTTHYILLPPGRPASASRRDRLQSEPTRKSNGGFWKRR